MGTIDTDSYTVGGIELYFDSTIAEDSLTTGTTFQTTARSIGNIVTSGLSSDVTYVDHFISVNGKRKKDKVVANTSVVTINFTFDEMNQDNLAKFTLSSSSASELLVLQNTLDEGSAQLMVKTSIGQDLIYRIPKCVIKPEGDLTFDAENWHEAPMSIEVLEYTDGENASATVNAIWLAAPMGKIDTANL